MHTLVGNRNKTKWKTFILSSETNASLCTELTGKFKVFAFRSNTSKQEWYDQFTESLY